MELRVVLLWRAEDTAWEEREDDLVKRIDVPCILPRGTSLLLMGDFESDTPVEIDDYYWDERQPEILTAETVIITIKGKAADFVAAMSQLGWHQ